MFLSSPIINFYFYLFAYVTVFSFSANFIYASDYLPILIFPLSLFLSPSFPFIWLYSISVYIFFDHIPSYFPYSIYLYSRISFIDCPISLCMYVSTHMFIHLYVIHSILSIHMLILFPLWFLLSSPLTSSPVLCANFCLFSL